MELLLADVIERLDESITVYDGEARLVFVNAAAMRPFGRPIEEILGKRPWELVPPGPRTPFREALEAVLAGGGKRTVLSEVRSLARWYEIDVYPHPPGALAVSRDVTERRHAEHELRDSEARFRAMVESAPEAILILDDASGKFVDVNECAVQLFCRTRAELLASGPVDLMTSPQPGGAEPDAVKRRYRREVLERGRADFDGVAKGADGAELHVEVHARRLPSTGAPLIRLSVFDVTAQRNAQEQLAEVQRLEAVARLAGGVAHDFNNMLSVILGSAQLALADLGPTHKVREDLLSVISAAERAALITRQLLTFARKQEAATRVLDLSAHIEKMLPVLQRVVGEDVEVELELARPLASARLDPAHVEQIILNLAANARDAMPKGGRLTLHTANVLLEEDDELLHDGVPPGRYVMMSVGDTGAGIPDHVKPHIFEPFFTTKELHRGTGLGLATVHGIVKQSAGHIWVYSEPGQGTTFKLYFPVVEQAVAAEEENRPDAPRGGRETIVVVEDDPAVRQFLRRTLERSGYTVVEAMNAGEALLIFETHEGAIDLMISDVVMPRMTGPQLAARLRALRPELRVILLSGYSEDRVEPDEALHDTFLSKPIAVDALLRRVREVLDRR